jgi:small subunit ribosomal protein S3
MRRESHPDERLAGAGRITVHTARPGIVDRQEGRDIERCAKSYPMMGIPVQITIEEILKPELDAQLVAESVAQQLERRIMFRRAMKRAVTNALRLGAQGIKINVSGRLGGAEIARSEWYREGRTADSAARRWDYGFAEARTTMAG